MKPKLIDTLMSALLTSGLALAGWGIIVAPDEPTGSAWSWSWSVQAE